TGAPVTGLARENFEVLDDGRPRALTYFSPAGERRHPLALVLVIDGCTGSQNVWLDKAAGVMERMAAALKQLPPEDEVAVLWTRCGDNDDPCSIRRLGSAEIPPLTVLQDLTRDREAVSAALRSVPRLAREMIEEERTYSGLARRNKNASQGWNASGIACAPDKALRLIAARPASQAALLFVTDDLGLVRSSDRDEMAERLTRAGVPVHGLVTGRPFLMNLGAAEFGVGSSDNRRANAVQYLAKETGGEALRVGDPDKYAEAFERIVGGLAARYSLGFTLGDDEPKDRRLHRLEVRVRVRDARGKGHGLTVSARRGYYAPDAAAGGAQVR
ncbi:MAG TPA: VWA domain-containing protein, partial [Pyrinomonadaceae bacterium]|nr:VWA domain-containing protein [Pyrinomonadaceae bacterium]